MLGSDRPRLAPHKCVASLQVRRFPWACAHQLTSRIESLSGAAVACVPPQSMAVPALFGVVFVRKSFLIGSDAFTRADQTHWTLDLQRYVGAGGDYSQVSVVASPRVSAGDVAPSTLIMKSTLTPTSTALRRRRLPQEAPVTPISTSAGATPMDSAVAVLESLARVFVESL